MRFQTVGTAQALAGIVGDDGELLVLQPGLWPDAEAALALLRGPPVVLVLPAGPGQQAGFERIDLERAWAGALILPGRLLGELTTLPEDIAPAPALLRVALQHKLPETRLSPGLIDDGSWVVLLGGEQAAAQERLWLRRVLGEAQGSAVSQRLAGWLMGARGADLVAWPRAVPLMLAGLVALLSGALAASWFGRPAAGFALLALDGPLVETIKQLARLRAAPAAPGRFWPWLGHARDAALLACAVLAGGGLWYRALFAPLVLLAGLLLLDQRDIAPRFCLLRDRGVLAAVLATLALALPFELALMLAALAVLAANFLPSSRPRG